MKKLLCILAFTLVTGIVISNCSGPGISTSDYSENELSMQNGPDSENDLIIDTQKNDTNFNSLLVAICQEESAILDSCSMEKNWIGYAETSMEYGPRIDEIRAHMVGLDSYPHDKSPCDYVPYYSQEQIDRIRSEGREDLAEKYIGINEAKRQLCK